MKNLLITSGIIAAILLVLFTYLGSCNSQNNLVTSDRFEQVQETLNYKIDRLEVNQKQMKLKLDSVMNILTNVQYDVDSIRYDIDTLKAGQVLIYSEVVNLSPVQSKQNWANRLIDFIK